PGQVPKCSILPTTDEGVLAEAQLYELPSTTLLSNVIPPLLCQVRPRPRPHPRSLDVVIDVPRPNHQFFIEPGIVDPKTGSTTGPFMPTVTVLGRVLSNGQPVDDAQITWAFKISGVYRVRSPGNRCGTVTNCRLQKYAFDFGRVVTT